MKNKRIIVILSLVIISLFVYIVLKQTARSEKAKVGASPQTQMNQNISEHQAAGGFASDTYTNTYKGKEFSFNYYKDAVEKTEIGIFGPYHYINVPGHDFPDYVSFFQGVVPDSANMCSSKNTQETGVVVKTTTVNGKTLMYCDSKEGEPSRTYLYTKGGKTLVINILQGSFSKPQMGYIDLGSLEIN